jgi:hypothetical protein
MRADDEEVALGTIFRSKAPPDGMPAVIPCISRSKAAARAKLEILPGTPEWIEKRLAALPF